MLYSIVFLVMIWVIVLFTEFDRQQIDNVLLDLVKDKLDEYQDEFMIIQHIVNF